MGLLPLSGWEHCPSTSVLTLGDLLGPLTAPRSVPPDGPGGGGGAPGLARLLTELQRALHLPWPKHLATPQGKAPLAKF